jgi:hypothetical protein
VPNLIQGHIGSAQKSALNVEGRLTVADENQSHAEHLGAGRVAGKWSAHVWPEEGFRSIVAFI